ncbi:PaaI family thioesterase [Legionella londiniensis]|uniref:Aromatic compounds catabolism n=1 Tax=Legionella londiniensis TaxID=45068 RepID=A0A0W0VTB7_9GAMM|nr:DUF4442 domain-containing protein [Legionella londiniensis]KTD23326.1 aromatic compounds catabolism [Legionella londiniensis]STX94119.1 aromatic compounds catabolism [Legionella londiniensis]
MTTLGRLKFFLWYFSRFKVPLIGYLKLQLLTLTDSEAVVRLRLKRRSKNHLNSMYFGALAIGADVAGGLHGFYHAKKNQVSISLAFKSFHASFLKRPESDVYFVCRMGETIRDMILHSRESKQRVNQAIEVKAFTHYFQEPEEVAQFCLELSIKAL